MVVVVLGDKEDVIKEPHRLVESRMQGGPPENVWVKGLQPCDEA